MIKNISAGQGINITNNYSSWPTFYNSTSSNSLVGQIRYNGTTQHMEVYDGTAWLTMSTTYPTIELSSDVQSVLNWARTKMDEEYHIKELAKTNATVADALEAVKRAEEQVRIVAALVQT